MKYLLIIFSVLFFSSNIGAVQCELNSTLHQEENISLQKDSKDKKKKKKKKKCKKNCEKNCCISAEKDSENQEGSPALSYTPEHLEATKNDSKKKSKKIKAYAKEAAKKEKERKKAEKAEQKALKAKKKELIEE